MRNRVLGTDLRCVFNLHLAINGKTDIGNRDDHQRQERNQDPEFYRRSAPRIANAILKKITPDTHRPYTSEQRLNGHDKLPHSTSCAVWTPMLAVPSPE